MAAWWCSPPAMMRAPNRAAWPHCPASRASAARCRRPTWSAAGWWRPRSTPTRPVRWPAMPTRAARPRATAWPRRAARSIPTPMAAPITGTTVRPSPRRWFPAPPHWSGSAIRISTTTWSGRPCWGPPRTSVRPAWMRCSATACSTSRGRSRGRGASTGAMWWPMSMRRRVARCGATTSSAAAGWSSRAGAPWCSAATTATPALPASSAASCRCRTAA